MSKYWLPVTSLLRKFIMDISKKTDEGQVDLNEFSKDVHLDLDKPGDLPIDQSTTILDDKGVPIEETPKEASAFNCQACQGTGLIDEHNVCSACNGTGKV